MKIYEDYGNAVSSSGGGLFGGGSLIDTIIAGFMTFFLIMLAIAVVMIIANWKIYTKAGKPGWASIVPIYGQIVLLEICELPTWQVIFYFIPFANIYIMFITNMKLAEKFGKSTGYGIAMVFFGVILLPMLAFGKAQYQGNGMNNNYDNNPYPNSQPMQQQPVQQPMQQPQTMASNQPDFCTQCGNQLPSGATFCTGCGKQL